MAHFMIGGITTDRSRVGPPFPDSTPAERWLRPACTGRTDWRATRCSRAWCSERGSPATCSNRPPAVPPAGPEGRTPPRLGHQAAGFASRARGGPNDPLERPRHRARRPWSALGRGHLPADRPRSGTGDPGRPTRPARQRRTHRVPDRPCRAPSRTESRGAHFRSDHPRTLPSWRLHIGLVAAGRKSPDPRRSPTRIKPRRGSAD